MIDRPGQSESYRGSDRQAAWTSLRALVAAIVRSAGAALTFNLPMSSLPHRATSTPVVLALIFVCIAMNFALGALFRVLLLTLLCGGLAILWKRHRDRDAAIGVERPMPALANIYLVGLAWLIGGACELLTSGTRFNALVQGPVAIWLGLLLIVYCPRISAHHRQLLAKASSESDAAADPESRGRAAAPEKTESNLR